MIIRYIRLLTAVFLFILGCGAEESNNDKNPDQNNDTSMPNIDEVADVTDIRTSGSSGNYTFSVTISSPDTGCNQYADYWEVVSLQGELLYRRILLHSHVNEQPFTRSGGSVAIAADEVVWIRAHMNNSGYGGQAMQGSVVDGFNKVDLDPMFATDLSSKEPLPDDCQF